jgi:succinate dehydrogenase / fumarate reductase flavoprotein subunit
MLDLVVVDGHAKGIIVPQPPTGEITKHSADAVVAGDRRLRQRLLTSQPTPGLERHRHLALPQARRLHCQSLLHADSPDVHPGGSGDYQSKLTLMSESLAQRRPRVGAEEEGRLQKSRPRRFPRRSRLLPRTHVSRVRQPRPRDIASRAAKTHATKGLASAIPASAVYLDFSDAIGASGKTRCARTYGNLFAMYRRSPARIPTRRRCASIPRVHYTMGGLWVDYNLMSNLPGLFVLGEANFSDHGANRLGASALMQGLADGYFVIPRPSAVIWRRRSARKTSVRRPIPRSSKPRKTSRSMTKKLLGN